MLRRSLVRMRFGLCAVAALALVTGQLWQAQPCLAGHQFFNNNAIGGISVSPDGVVGQQIVESRELLLAALKKSVRTPDRDLNMPVEMRMISLSRLEAAIEKARQENLGELPEEIRYLAGIQRIQYILVYPEQNDIVLAGPGEGWRVDERTASVVGITTGRPVILLDDLLVALRTVEQARQGGITVSIDPTAEGRQALRSYLSRQTTFDPKVLRGVEEALGMQHITVTGVPADSHFARVLVACDYKMKRLAMDLDKSPVKELPSFVQMLVDKKVRPSNMMPRWWMECSYEPLARSEDGLAWELRGPGVKALTEDEFISTEGEVTQTGKENPIAREWADKMTEKYAELCEREPVFGELRNIMDMCVVAAVIEKEGLREKAGCDLPLLTASDSDLTVGRWNVPKTIATQVSHRRIGREHLITASGGVQIGSWQVASRAETDAQVAALRDKAKGESSERWWWN